MHTFSKGLIFRNAPIFSSRNCHTPLHFAPLYVLSFQWEYSQVVVTSSRTSRKWGLVVSSYRRILLTSQLALFHNLLWRHTRFEMWSSKKAFEGKKRVKCLFYALLIRRCKWTPFLSSQKTTCICKLFYSK